MQKNEFKVLEEIVAKQNFGFVDSFPLTKRGKGVLKVILVYAVSLGENRFPQLSDLDRHVKKNAIHHDYLSMLAVEGFLEHRKRGEWLFGSKVLEYLRNEAKTLSHEQNPDSRALSLSSRGEKLLNYINRERVGDSLCLTPEHIRSIADILECSKYNVYNMLRGMENVGQYQYNTHGKCKGVLLAFLQKNEQGRMPAREESAVVESCAPNAPTEKNIKAFTVSEVVEMLNGEISVLNQKAEEAANEHARLTKLALEKSELIAKLQTIIDERRGAK